MIDIEKFRALETGTKLLAFSEFIVREKGDRLFPDYRGLDLMKILRLVPNI